MSMSMNMKTVKAFYFATEERKLRYNDNRDIVVGETHSVDGKIMIGYNGLHASEKLLDAVKFAPGNILYLVELSGDMDHGDDKFAASNRKYLAEFDATELLHEFARKQALIHIDKIKRNHLEEEYNSIVAYLETGDEKLWRRAWSSAYDVRKHFAGGNGYDYNIASAAYYACHHKMANYADLVAYNVSRAVRRPKVDVREQQNQMLTQMVKQATGWDI